MNGQSRARLVQSICDSYTLDQLDRCVKTALNRPREHFAIAPDLPTIVDKLIEELERTPDKLFTFLLNIREKSTAGLRSAVDAYLGIVSDTSGVVEAEHLRSNGPERSLPHDYKPCLFKDVASGEDDLRPMRSHVLSWKESEWPQCCFIVGPHGQDLELTLLDIEDILVERSRGEQQNTTTIWIRGDELLSHADPENMRSSREQISLVFRQLWSDPTNYSLNSLERLLNNSKYSFLVDFGGLRLDDLFSLHGDKPQPELTFVADVLRTFIDFVTKRNHFVVVGLPRFVFALEEWRRLMEVTKITLFTADLFIPHRAEGGALGFASIPSVISRVLIPLHSSNSYSLQQLAANLGREVENSNLIAADRRRQLAEVLGIAGILEKEGFIEPAYRVEMWYRRQLGHGHCSSSAADLFNMATSGHSDIVGLVENIADLPRVTNAALITGESGIGKTTALEQIETSWCLPKPTEPGRRGRHWLPIYLDSLGDLTNNIPEAFRRRSTTSQCNRDATRLSVHQRMSRLVTTDNLSWIFSSPILFLVDDLGGQSDDSFARDWIGSAATDQTFGLFVCCRHRSEVPVWFRRTFPDSVEARIRPLDLVSAQDMCTTAEQVDTVSRLFSSPCEPLNQCVQNRFLLTCILDSTKSGHFGAGLSLVDLLDVFTRRRLVEFEPDFATSLLLDHFPGIASALARGEIPVVSAEIKNAGALQSILEQGEVVRFTHPRLQEYFLAKHIARNWNNDPGPLFDSHLGTKRDLWPIRHLNLFRMLMKELGPTFRPALSEFLSELDIGLAHRCLLELSFRDYCSVPNSKAIRDSLVASIQRAIPEGAMAEQTELAKRVDAAESLAWYDPRVLTSLNPNERFVELQVDDGPRCRAGKYPITNLEYADFVQAGGYSSEQFWMPTAWTWRTRNKIKEPAFWSVTEFNRPNSPVVGVSFYEALAYARWLENRGSEDVPHSTSATFGLPTDYEWSRAAGLTIDLREVTQDESVGIFALNEPIIASRSASARRATLQTNTNTLSRYSNLPVGLLPCEPCAVYDLLGNVWEWCDEWFGSHTSYDERPSLTDLRGPFPVVVRGGPATTAGGAVVSIVGSGMDPFSRVFNVGFRLFQEIVESNND
jgi:formylglycine-generating enzyme required for sulfatase activity